MPFPSPSCGTSADSQRAADGGASPSKGSTAGRPSTLSKFAAEFLGTFAQFLGGIAAGAALFAVLSGKPEWSVATDGFATNGYGELSPGGFSLLSVLIVEFVLTAIFLFVILGTTDGRAAVGFAPLAIGLTLTLIHLVSIPVSNTSVNPARSLGMAVFGGADALGQVWAFFVAPLAGAAVAGLLYSALFGADDEQIENNEETAIAAA